ncbi:ATPase family associated with various cellular activities (AAA) [Theobroma cacao]|uniref:ATPase family associated with various cellular activities (AAA) n=1 Tax=Theobroma cacao TaxID=3641 RepID=A0A061G307_THECC|nr:ATPase family associated with various cellular activities (AAA) [Theobroma cacao]
MLVPKSFPDDLRCCQGRDSQKQRKFTWAKKYQPKALKDFICHREIAEKVETLVTVGDAKHVIIDGFPGIGKRTMALALLRENFGLDILETREQVQALDLESVLKRGLTSSIQITVQASAKHIEVDLSESDIRGYATEVALLIIKETHNALTKQPPLQHNLENAKAIVFHQAEKLSKNAQPQIRRFLENSKGQYKVIFCCSDICKLQILTPLCRVIHLPPPPNKEIVGVLNFIAKQEDIELPHTLAQTIAENSNHCLRQAIRSLEATWLADYPFNEGQSIMTGWEDELAIMAKSIIEEQSLNMLFLVRKKFIRLMEHHICREFVLGTLVAELKKHVLDSQTQLDLESLYQEISKPNEDFSAELSYKDEVVGNRIRKLSRFSFATIEVDPHGTKHYLFPLTEFVAKFMSYYKIKRVQSVSSLTGANATHQKQCSQKGPS